MTNVMRVLFATFCALMIFAGSAFAQYSDLLVPIEHFAGGINPKALQLDASPQQTGNRMLIVAMSEDGSVIGTLGIDGNGNIVQKYLMNTDDNSMYTGSMNNIKALNKDKVTVENNNFAPNLLKIGDYKVAMNIKLFGAVGLLKSNKVYCIHTARDGSTPIKNALPNMGSSYPRQYLSIND